MNQETAFYVSTVGNDRNDGSLEFPFRTISGARNAIRKRGHWHHGDVVVYIRGGVYEIESPVEFTSQDSGKNGFFTRYTAYPQENPVISGGVRVTGWELHHGNIFKAELKRASKLRQLYVNGKRVHMARGKSFGYAQIIRHYGEYHISGNEPWALDTGHVAAGIEVSKEILPLCKHPEDLEICGQAGFGFHTVSLSGMVEQEECRIALFANPAGAIAQSVPVRWGGGFLSNLPELNAVGEYYFQNAYEFLHDPGHFYFDRHNSTLYYYKHDHEEMDRLEVFAPLSEGLLKLKGTSTKNRIENLVFSGLTFAHSHWSMMEVDNSRADTTIQSVCMYTKYKSNGDIHEVNYSILQNQGAAIETENAKGIHFIGNSIQNIGAIGIAYGNDTTHSEIRENRFRDIGSSAIHVGDAKHVYIGDHDFPPDEEGLCEYISIKENVLQDTAMLSRQAPALSVVFGRQINIESNRIENCPYTGISLGWGWMNFASSHRPNPTTSLGCNKIVNNALLNVCHSLHDGAAIYVLGEQPYSEICGNFIKGCGGAYHGNAIYLDQASAYFKVERNHCMAYNGSWFYVWGKEAMVHHIKVSDNYADRISGLEGDNLHDSDFTNAESIDTKLIEMLFSHSGNSEN